MYQQRIFQQFHHFPLKPGNPPLGHLGPCAAKAQAAKGAALDVAKARIADLEEQLAFATRHS